MAKIVRPVRVVGPIEGTLLGRTSRVWLVKDAESPVPLSLLGSDNFFSPEEAQRFADFLNGPPDTAPLTASVAERLVARPATKPAPDDRASLLERFFLLHQQMAAADLHYLRALDHGTKADTAKHSAAHDRLQDEIDGVHARLEERFYPDPHVTAPGPPLNPEAQKAIGEVVEAALRSIGEAL